MLYFKFVHIISAFIWFGGLLSLSCLLSVMAKENNQHLIQTAKNVYRKIVLPSSMIATFLGLFSAYYFYKFAGGWIHIKIVLVTILWGYQLYAKKIMIGFALGLIPNKFQLNNIFYGILLIFTIIVFLATTRPF